LNEVDVEHVPMSAETAAEVFVAEGAVEVAVEAETPPAEEENKPADAS